MRRIVAAKSISDRVDRLSANKNTIGLLCEQETQRLGEALGPLALAVSCALVDFDQQSAIIQPCPPQRSLQFANIFHDLPVFIFASRFPRAYCQKNFRRPLPDQAAELNNPSIRNKQ